jgi:hypothetical protein
VALQIGGETTMPSSETTVIHERTDPGKLQAVVKKRNVITVAKLTMAFTTDGTMALVYKSKTSTWPSGVAHLI